MKNIRYQGQFLEETKRYRIVKRHRKRYLQGMEFHCILLKGKKERFLLEGETKIRIPGRKMGFLLVGKDLEILK